MRTARSRDQGTCARFFRLQGRKKLPTNCRGGALRAAVCFSISSKHLPTLEDAQLFGHVRQLDVLDHRFVFQHAEVVTRSAVARLADLASPALCQSAVNSCKERALRYGPLHRARLSFSLHSSGAPSLMHIRTSAY